MNWFPCALSGGILSMAVLAVLAEGMARSTVVDMATTTLSVLAVVLSLVTIARAAA